MSGRPFKAVENLLSRLQGSPLFRDAVTTSAYTVVGRSGGMLIPFFIAAWYGIQAATDAFFLCYSIVLVVQSIFSLVLENVSVPFIGEKRARQENPGLFVGRLLLLGTAGIFGLMLILLLLLRPLLGAATNYPPDTMRLLGRMLWEISPLVVVSFWSSILSGVLNAYRRFMLPALSPLLRAVVILIFAFGSRRLLGIHAVIMGYIVGEVFRLLILAVALRGLPGFRLGFSFGFDCELREFLRTASYQMAAMVAFSVNVAVDKVMAARLGEGKVSLLYYAERLNVIPYALILGGVMAPVLSHWSERFATQGIHQLRRNLKQAMLWLGLFSLCMCAGGIVFRQPLLRIAFLRGRFDPGYLAEAGLVFSALLAGLVPHALATLTSRALLIIRQTRAIMVGALGTVVLNAAFNLLLMRFWGTAGIALSTSLTHLFYLAYLWRTFRRLAAAEGIQTR